MERIPHGKYTKEFREEAVKLVIGREVIDTGNRQAFELTAEYIRKLDEKI